MQYFYDGQVRRYITQIIRVFSNFSVKYADGSLHRIPVTYGDADRQVANIVQQNSENKLNTVPKIAVYVSQLSLDWERTFDPSFVGKTSIRERAYDPKLKKYTYEAGMTYTVERPSPTPFKLICKVDIWSANTEQKLQILEQLLVMFNPALEIQTNDNYFDWTSLSILLLNDVNWSSRSIPMGTDSPIDIATLTVETPIWISPPIRVTRAGIITKVIANIWDQNHVDMTALFDGDNPFAEGMITEDALLTRMSYYVEDYNLIVSGNQAYMLEQTGSAIDHAFVDPEEYGDKIAWLPVIEQYRKEYINGSGRIFLDQGSGYEVVGTFKINNNPDLIDIVWDLGSIIANTGIDSDGILDYEPNYMPTIRPNSPGTFDAIINPLEYNPKRPLKEETDQPILLGIRYLLLDDIGDESNALDEIAQAWAGTDGTQLIAHANDIVEWNGTSWQVIFESGLQDTSMVWMTNTYSGIQYHWNGVQWKKSYEGVYKPGLWRIEF